jgi:hypothetical protein
MTCHILPLTIATISAASALHNLAPECPRRAARFELRSSAQVQPVGKQRRQRCEGPMLLVRMGGDVEQAAQPTLSDNIARVQEAITGGTIPL